jgi:hypothetical protein
VALIHHVQGQGEFMTPEQRNAVIAEYEERIATLEDDIALLEKGDLRFSSKRAGGKWVDVNEKLIDQDQHVIEVYKDIIRRYQDGSFR